MKNKKTTVKPKLQLKLNNTQEEIGKIDLKCIKELNSEFNKFLGRLESFNVKHSIPIEFDFKIRLIVEPNN